MEPSGQVDAWPNGPTSHWSHDPIVWRFFYLTILSHDVIQLIGPTVHWSYAWWPHQMEFFFALIALCAGNSPVTGEFPSQRPVTRSFDIFFDLYLNKLLIKRPWHRWFETPLRSIWRHCNGPHLRPRGPMNCSQDGHITKIPILMQISYTSTIYEIMTCLYSPCTIGRDYNVLPSPKWQSLGSLLGNFLWISSK